MGSSVIKDFPERPSTRHTYTRDGQTEQSIKAVVKFLWNPLTSLFTTVWVSTELSEKYRTTSIYFEQIEILTVNLSLYFFIYEGWNCFFPFLKKFNGETWMFLNSSSHLLAYQLVESLSVGPWLVFVSPGY